MDTPGPGLGRRYRTRNGYVVPNTERTASAFDKCSVHSAAFANPGKRIFIHVPEYSGSCEKRLNQQFIHANRAQDVLLFNYLSGICYGLPSVFKALETERSTVGTHSLVISFAHRSSCGYKTLLPEIGFKVL